MRQPGFISFVTVLAVGVLVALLLPGCDHPRQADERPAHHHLADVATVGDPAHPLLVADMLGCSTCPLEDLPFVADPLGRSEELPESTGDPRAE